MLCPRPLESLFLASELDGRSGTNRAGTGRSIQLGADNDLQAVQAWLNEFRDSPRTLRNYRKEVERLLLWTLLERRKAFSSLNREDLVIYEDFLADPQPREQWCGPKMARASPRWRPFQGPLSPASRRTALLVINSLFSYLVKAGYLAGNPLALTRRRRHPAEQARSPERFLEQDQWRLLLETVENLPTETERQRQYYERARFLMALLYLLGPRVGELATHGMASFVETRGRWWWQVTGKGQKSARVPVNQDMLQALQRYRGFLGLSPMPAPDESTPLILNLKGTAGISDNMIYRVVKDLVVKTALRLEKTDPHRAAHLRQASTHWLRHTSITHQADAGIDLRFLQRNARHTKFDTTALYLHAEEEQWHAAMERHRFHKD